jgi:hypothetical protein
MHGKTTIKNTASNLMLFREIIAACCKALEHYEYTLGRM